MSDEGIFSDTDTEMEMEMAENEDMKASIKPLSLTSKFQGDFNSNMVVRSYAYPVANYKIKVRFLRLLPSIILFEMNLD